MPLDEIKWNPRYLGVCRCLSYLLSGYSEPTRMDSSRVLLSGVIKAGMGDDSGMVQQVFGLIGVDWLNGWLTLNGWLWSSLCFPRVRSNSLRFRYMFTNTIILLHTGPCGWLNNYTVKIVSTFLDEILFLKWFNLISAGFCDHVGEHHLLLTQYLNLGQILNLKKLKDSMQFYWAQLIFFRRSHHLSSLIYTQNNGSIFFFNLILKDCLVSWSFFFDVLLPCLNGYDQLLLWILLGPWQTRIWTPI